MGSNKLPATPVFNGIHVAQSLFFYVVFCSSLFFPFYFIVLSVLRFMSSNNPLGIFNLFSVDNNKIVLN